jgi:hypothetical protein
MVFVEKLRTVLDKYDIWRDRGIVPMAEEDKMYIEFVEGW